MIITFKKYGNSTVLPIPKKILELLKITLDTEITLETDGTSLLIKPLNQTNNVKEISRKIIKKRKTLLQKLADE